MSYRGHGLGIKVGTVIRSLPEGYGFISCPDFPGKDIFFHWLGYRIPKIDNQNNFGWCTSRPRERVLPKEGDELVFKLSGFTDYGRLRALEWTYFADHDRVVDELVERDILFDLLALTPYHRTAS